MPLIEPLDGTRISWLPGYRVKSIDGNCLEARERRLKALREVQGGPLPGKSLVVYEPAYGLVSEVFPCEDGHAQERSLCGAVLATVHADDLWIQDRHFCPCAFLCEINARVVSLNCRDETYPQCRTGTRWHAIDSGMLPRRDRTAMLWSPRHHRQCHRHRRSQRAPRAQRTGIACGLGGR